jgi:hypothetical protein
MVAGIDGARRPYPWAGEVRGRASQELLLRRQRSVAGAWAATLCTFTSNGQCGDSSADIVVRELWIIAAAKTIHSLRDVCQTPVRCLIRRLLIQQLIDWKNKCSEKPVLRQMLV